MLRARPTLRLAHSSGEHVMDRSGENPPDFKALFDTHYAWVAAMAGRLSGRSGDVEDIVQDVFFLCARKLDTIPTMADAKPWLRTVTVRVVQKRLRRRKWQSWFLSSDDEIPNLPYRGIAPDERVILQGLYDALDELPVDERLAWMMRHVEGFALDDVAKSCNCSLATAKRRIAKASLALQKGEHLALQD